MIMVNMYKINMARPLVIGMRAKAMTAPNCTLVRNSVLVKEQSKLW